MAAGKFLHSDLGFLICKVGVLIATALDKMNTQDKTIVIKISLN